MNDCIISSYNKNAGGYGRFTLDSKVINHHRAVYCETNKVSVESIAGLVVRHTCDTPACINPAHLVIGTQKDNCADKKARGRPNGGGAPRSLTDEQVKEIRAAFNPNQYELAAKYNVSQATINNVRCRTKAYSKR